MPAKQGSSPKLKRAGKKHRVVANPKPVNRTGKGKAQPRTITSEARIAYIRMAVRREMAAYLKLRDIELFNEDGVNYLREDYANGLTGLDDDKVQFELVERVLQQEQHLSLLKSLQEAFVFGYKAVPDAPLVPIPGANLPFFGEMEAKLEQNRSESRRNRQKQPSKGRGKPAGQFAQAVANAGHGNGSRANVALQVAKASGLVSA